MKKFLSMILAMAMLISLVPSVFADGTEGDAAQEYSGITVKYDFTKFEGAEVDASAKVDYSKTFGFWEFRTRGGKKATGGGTSSRNVVKSANGHLQVVARVNWDTDNQNAVTYANTDWVAFEITVPKAGLYDVTLNNVSYGLQGGTVGLWILPGSTNDNSIDGMLTEGTYLKSFDFMYDAKLGYVSFATEEVTLDDAYYFNADTYIFVYKVLEGHACAKKTTEIKSSDIGDMYLNGITLDGDGADEANYVPMISSLTATEIDGTTTVSAVAELMSNSEPATGVTYSYAVAEDDKVKAEIINGNVVKGLAGGTATIIATATKDGLSSSKSIEVEVTAPPAAEPDEPGEEVEDTTPSVSVLPENSNEGNVTGIDTPVGEVAMGTTINPTAIPADGYKFAYWKDSSGTVLSINPNEKFVINTNTAITAVFDKIMPESADKTTVELYNANGMLFHKNENVALNTSFADVATAAGTPSLVGYVFKHWSMYANEAKIEDTMPITALTRAVAIYEEPEAQYTVKVDGADVIANKKYKYGEEVTVTAQNTNFSCWKLGDKVVSYEPKYTFSVWGNVDLTEGTEETEAPVASLVKNGNNHLLIYSVPAGYTKVEAGIIFSKTDNITVDSFDGQKSSEVRGTGQFMVWSDYTYARGYLIFKNNTSGEIRILYAD